MEDIININEYVRTDNGIIGKYVKYRGIEDAIETNNKWIGFDIEKDIVKHSSNLIDLIQKDDFVNGDRVVSIDYTEDENGNYVDVLGIMEIDDDYAYPIELRVINIQEVVTKEMMESVSYKVKE